MNTAFYKQKKKISEIKEILTQCGLSLSEGLKTEGTRGFRQGCIRTLEE